MTSNFEKASKLKLRYPAKKGNVTTEDLWDLPLESRSGTSLDETAKTLSREIKASAEESFVAKKSSVSSTLELKLEIVKHVIAFRLAQAEKRQAALADKAKREQLLSLRADKVHDGMRELTVDEIDAELAKMES